MHDGVYLGGREGGREGGTEGGRDGWREGGGGEGGGEGAGEGGTHPCTSANCRGRQSGSQPIYMPSSPTWLLFLSIY